MSIDYSKKIVFAHHAILGLRIKTDYLTSPVFFIITLPVANCAGSVYSFAESTNSVCQFFADLILDRNNCGENFCWKEVGEFVSIVFIQKTGGASLVQPNPSVNNLPAPTVSICHSSHTPSLFGNQKTKNDSFLLVPGSVFWPSLIPRNASEPSWSTHLTKTSL